MAADAAIPPEYWRSSVFEKVSPDTKLYVQEVVSDTRHVLRKEQAASFGEVMLAVRDLEKTVGQVSTADAVASAVTKSLVKVCSGFATFVIAAAAVIAIFVK